MTANNQTKLLPWKPFKQLLVLF